MKKKIALITGATGGIGRSFVEELIQKDLDEVWVIGRNEKKLIELVHQYGDHIIPIVLDLSLPSQITLLQDRLHKESCNISYLINNAGVGETLDSYESFSLSQIQELIAVNCTAVVQVCSLVLPYMTHGGHILNISSQSSFQPVPYLNLYASSKVFVRNYTRALHVELKQRRISATAVCPGWVDTEMLVHELNGKPVSFPHMITTKQVAQQALRDANKNKDMSVCTWYVKTAHVLAKLFPQRMVMHTWMNSIKPYLREM